MNYITNCDLETPQTLFLQLDEQFHFTVDVCANKHNHKCHRYFAESQECLDDPTYLERVDGLRQDWSKEIAFMSPPSKKHLINKWIQKASTTAEQGGTVVALLPARTDAEWFHKYIYEKPNAKLTFLRGNIPFKKKGKRSAGSSMNYMTVLFKKNVNVDKDSKTEGPLHTYCRDKALYHGKILEETSPKPSLPSSDVMKKIDFTAWATPTELFTTLNKIFKFTLDPCADILNHKCEKYYTEEDNGLSQDWGQNSVFMNPPWKKGKNKTNLNDWVKKASETARNGGSVVALLPTYTCTGWFQDNILKNPEVKELFFLNGRVHYISPKAHIKGSKNYSQPTFGSMLVHFESKKTVSAKLKVHGEISQLT